MCLWCLRGHWPRIKHGIERYHAHQEATQRRELRERVIQDLIELSDINRDGTATAAEIAATLDKDDNGEVTLDEVRKALQAVGASPSTIATLVNLLELGPGGLVSTAAIVQLLDDILGDADVEELAALEEQDSGDGGAAGVSANERGPPPIQVAPDGGIGGGGGGGGASGGGSDVYLDAGTADGDSKAADDDTTALSAAQVKSLFRAVNHVRIGFAKKRLEAAAIASRSYVEQDDSDPSGRAAGVVVGDVGTVRTAHGPVVAKPTLTVTAPGTSGGDGSGGGAIVRRGSHLVKALGAFKQKASFRLQHRVRTHAAGLRPLTLQERAERAHVLAVVGHTPARAHLPPMTPRGGGAAAHRRFVFDDLTSPGLGSRRFFDAPLSHQHEPEHAPQSDASVQRAIEALNSKLDMVLAKLGSAPAAGSGV